MPPFLALLEPVPQDLLAGLENLDAVLNWILENRPGIRINGGVQQYRYEKLRELFEEAGQTKLFEALIGVLEYRLKEGARSIKVPYNSAEPAVFTIAHKLWAFLFSDGHVRPQDFHIDLPIGFVQVATALTGDCAPTLLLNPGAPFEREFADHTRELLGQFGVLLPEGEGLEFMAKVLGEPDIPHLKLYHKEHVLRRPLLCDRDFIEAHKFSPAARLKLFDAIAMGPEVHGAPGNEAKDGQAGVLTRGVCVSLGFTNLATGYDEGAQIHSWVAAADFALAAADHYYQTEEGCTEDEADLKARHVSTCVFLTVARDWAKTGSEPWAHYPEAIDAIKYFCEYPNRPLPMYDPTDPTGAADILFATVYKALFP